MAFRISFGLATCKGVGNGREPCRSVCKRVLERVESLKFLRYEQLKAFRDQDPEVETILGKEVVFTVFKQDVDAGKVLVVVQAFFPTWEFPNYFSFSGVGKLFSEGIVITPSGTISDVSGDVLREYR